MGGNGALKIGMLFSNVFGAVYALSPAVLNWSGDFTIRNRAWKKISLTKNEKDILNGLNDPENTDDVSFWAAAMTDLARTYSPNENKFPFKANFPVSYIGDSVVINVDVIKQWETNFPVNMIADHLSNLKSLVALKLDWGRNEEFPHIPITCMEFSKKLDAYRVNHYAEEYIGDHSNKLAGWDGRIYTEMLPFFDTYLKFGEQAAIPSKMKEKK
jgi:S-formylglutathione hydrolase FrmB